ncbi:MAG: ABC transporter permease [Opitutales bacterium]
MISFLIKRILGAIPVVFIIITLSFFMLRLAPSGPFDRERAISQEKLDALNAYYSFDKPVYEQYFIYLKNLAKGDFGPSYKYEGWQVTELIVPKAITSLQLGAFALLIALFFGVLIGITSAKDKDKLSGKFLNELSLMGVCLPSFVVAPILILIFSLKLGWLPAIGWGGIKEAILPAFSLSLFYMAWVAKLTRTQSVEILEKPYIKTARAKGISNFRVCYIHTLKNASIALASYIAPAAAGLMTGSFVIESIFQISGLGRFFISSALDNDYTMIMACVIIYAVLIIVFNILSDVILAFLNPKIAKNLGIKK